MFTMPQTIYGAQKKESDVSIYISNHHSFQCRTDDIQVTKQRRSNNGTMTLCENVTE